MTQEARLKWERLWYSVKEFLPWIIAGFSTGAALGLARNVGELNGRTEKLERTQGVIIEKHNELCEVVGQHADAGNKLVDRVKDLERQNNMLLEEALKRTEGKTE